MDYKFPKIRLGLCCINILLRYNEDIYSTRKKTIKIIMKKGIDDAIQSAKANVIDLAKMVLWNKNHGIEVMRVSSELVPHSTNPEIIKLFGSKGEEYSKFEFLRPYLQKVGHIVKLEKVRLTMHPAQFSQIASPSESVFQSTINELDMHARILDMMELPPDSVMVVHIGGMYCDKTTTIERFIQRFYLLPENVKRRLVLENDEKCYDADEVLGICERLNVPMVFDIFHYYCYKKYHPDVVQKPINELMPRILQTWKKRGIRPKCHLSEQQPGLPIGSHSIFVDIIPKELLEIPSKYNTEIDIMLEAKAKEFAIERLYKKYPTLKPTFARPIPSEIPKKALKDLYARTKDMGDDGGEGCMCKADKK